MLSDSEALHSPAIDDFVEMKIISDKKEVVVSETAPCEPSYRYFFLRLLSFVLLGFSSLTVFDGRLLFSFHWFLKNKRIGIFPVGFYGMLSFVSYDVDARSSYIKHQSYYKCSMNTDDDLCAGCVSVGALCASFMIVSVFLCGVGTYLYYKRILNDKVVFRRFVLLSDSLYLTLMIIVFLCMHFACVSQVNARSRYLGPSFYLALCSYLCMIPCTFVNAFAQNILARLGHIVLEESTELLKSL